MVCWQQTTGGGDGSCSFDGSGTGRGGGEEGELYMWMMSGRW